MRFKFVPAVVLVFSGSCALGQSWTIGNDRIEGTIKFDATAGLVTQRLTDLATHTDLISAGKPGLELGLACNGQNLNGSSFRLLKADEGTLPDGKSLTIVLESKTFPLQVSVVYRVYDGQPAIRKWLVLKNAGSEPLHVSHRTIEAIAPSVGLANETVLNALYGAAPRETFYTGRSEDAGLLISNPRTGDGFGIVSEVPGYMKRTEINAWYDPGRVQLRVLYDTDLMPFERTLAPGAGFKTAATSLVTFRNGDGFHDSQWVLPSYTSAVLQRKSVAHGAPWIYNT